MDQKLSARSQFRQAEHIRKVQAPEREDERLASPTVLHFMKQHTQSLPDPNREQRITKKQEKLRAIEEEKKEERRNALHTLYMNARDFIVTEADLNEKVDQVFDDPWFKQNEGYSIWDKEGLPEGVTDMLGRLNKKSMKSAIEYNSGYAQITRERVQRIAEELTGGKM
jgi:protein-tyrosine-phosphatase